MMAQAEWVIPTLDSVTPTLVVNPELVDAVFNSAAIGPPVNRGDQRVGHPNTQPGTHSRCPHHPPERFGSRFPRRYLAREDDPAAWTQEALAACRLGSHDTLIAKVPLALKLGLSVLKPSAVPVMSYVRPGINLRGAG